MTEEFWGGFVFLSNLWYLCIQQREEVYEREREREREPQYLLTYLGITCLWKPWGKHHRMSLLVAVGLGHDKVIVEPCPHAELPIVEDEICLLIGIGSVTCHACQLSSFVTFRGLHPAHFDTSS